MSFLLLAVIGLFTGGLAGHILKGQDRSTAVAPVRVVANTTLRRKRH